MKLTPTVFSAGFTAGQGNSPEKEREQHVLIMLPYSEISQGLRWQSIEPDATESI
jgi:hypothetical protein